MTTQLRKYTIKKGKLEEFATAWMGSVYPLRLKHGFKVELAGVIEETNELVCVVTGGDGDDWADKEAAYYGSEEHARLEPLLLPHIAGSDTWFIRSVLPPP
jgi:hypothetical protein